MSIALQILIAGGATPSEPDAPTGVSATALTSSSASVSWSAPANNGNNITSYTITSSPGGITKTVYQSGGGTTEITGLTVDTTYTFTVYATNDVGNSPNSSASNSVTPVARLMMNPTPTAVGGNDADYDISTLSPFSLSYPYSSAQFSADGANYSVRFKFRGNTPSPNGGTGGYVYGTVTLVNGRTYYGRLTDEISGLFESTSSVQAPTCIMLAGEGGHGGGGSYTPYPPPHPPAPSGQPGGNAGYPSGGSGTPLNGSGGGGGGTTSGYLSGTGGSPGPRGGTPTLFAGDGGTGGLFSYGPGGPGTDGSGGRGGMGYYGGGGGGGGWDTDYDFGGYFGGGGGGGSSYYGGIPPTGPYPTPVSSGSSGTETGGVQMEIVSITKL